MQSSDERAASMRVETPDILTDLRRRLITAAFAPGAKLKPSELQNLYGCSANTVRDVLLQLSALGLVDFEIQRGFRAAAASPARLDDVTRFRILLEQQGAVASMARGGVDWESRLSAAHHRLKHIETLLSGGELDAEHTRLWSDAEAEFHNTLISACGSPVLRTTYASIYAQFRQQLVCLDSDFSATQFARIVVEHQAIVDAALHRDADACRIAIANHLSRHTEDGGASAAR